jgi:K+-transporting ATPase ATPase C chain
VFAQQLKAALAILGAMTLITGVAYPLAVTGLAQVAFPHQANGSLIMKDGKPAGSELIGQQFDDPKYFWGRLSGTTPAYNAGASSGTNFGPLNSAFKDAAKARIDALHATDPDNQSPVPVDLVTASGSGLDPHISPAAAEYQVARVAKARGLDPARVRTIVSAHTRDRDLVVLGEPVVNVLELNMALDAVR